MKDIPQFVIIKDKITIENDIDFNHIKAHFQNENDITFIETDGLKMQWKEKWVHIRKSNTEPIIRIISEAIDSNTAKGLINSITNIIT